MKFQLGHGQEQWKLVDFDAVTPVGETLPHVFTAASCPPEMATAVATGTGAGVTRTVVCVVTLRSVDCRLSVGHVGSGALGVARADWPPVL